MAESISCTAPMPISASVCASVSGCIRLRDNDIKALYNTISPGTKVNIINTPIKASVEPDGPPSG
ncbi:LysM domain/ErfK/YbiS/YcfS/YnhG family protein [Klebsiella pneumoniae subsp. ozaenae]|uniref:LysM domain/ErfK/YbiS/YcfS/YnhG family protein n=1 Tax=Klebsiella pneumoniae subsp. ozaenae TaxID=574 RepID=A0A377ZW76_KLEPO|nr:LysM domain/ErfK/YbiS/YcfS/YnhG family protein [Klebsiella pneumoniae subsp. ozaenae]